MRATRAQVASGVVLTAPPKTWRGFNWNDSTRDRWLSSSRERQAQIEPINSWRRPTGLISAVVYGCITVCGVQVSKWNWSTDQLKKPADWLDWLIQYFTYKYEILCVPFTKSRDFVECRPANTELRWRTVWHLTQNQRSLQMWQGIHALSSCLAWRECSSNDSAETISLLLVRSFRGGSWGSLRLPPCSKQWQMWQDLSFPRKMEIIRSMGLLMEWCILHRGLWRHKVWLTIFWLPSRTLTAPASLLAVWWFKSYS